MEKGTIKTIDHICFMHFVEEMTPTFYEDRDCIWNMGIKRLDKGGKDSIVQREVVSAERVQAPPTTKGYADAKRSGQASYSKYIDDGKWKGYTPPPLPEK